jgi:hypothetical protein
MCDISAENGEENGVAYTRVTYVIRINPRGWDLILANQGFNYLDGSTLVRALKTDENGKQRPSPSPVPLDTDGTLLADDAPRVSLTFQIYERVDWSGLALPEAM